MSRIGDIAARNGVNMHLLPLQPLPPLSRVGAPYWDDQPLAIVGAGASLKGFDFSRLNIPGVRVLAVKWAALDLPFAVALFGLDRPWMTRHADQLSAMPMPKLLAVEQTVYRVPIIAGASYFEMKRFPGFSEDPGVIQSGANSGFGAVNYAYLKRAGRNGKPIVLFGFDYSANAGHYCQERYVDDRGKVQATDHNARYWLNWGDNFNDCRAQIERDGITIINASPTSTLKAFPKCTVEEGLRCLENARSS